MKDENECHMRKILEVMENNPDFVNSIIMGDERLCFAYDPPIKGKSVA